MIVTTAGRTNDEMISIAKRVAHDLQISFVRRQKASIKEMIFEQQDDLFVISKNRFVIYSFRDPSEPIFFHPNSAMFRVKRILKGEEDPFIQAGKLEAGMSVLDCTLGLASDSIVASSVLGNNGQVTGIEGNRYIAHLISKGLKMWDSGHDHINESMRRIDVIHDDHLNFLKEQKNNAFDVVYFDPMFDYKIEESDGIKGLRALAIHSDLLNETMEQALRVAGRRVVLKDHWKSTRFAKFQFNVYKRKSSKFHFGVIEK